MIGPFLLTHTPTNMCESAILRIPEHMRVFLLVAEKVGLSPHVSSEALQPE